MTEHELELIEKYLNNTLSEPEKVAFEQSLADNAALRQELERYQLAVQSVRLHGRAQLRKRWNEQQGPSTDSAARPWWRAGILVGIVALIIVSAVGWWRLKTQDPIFRQPVAPTDTIESPPAHPLPGVSQPPKNTAPIPIARDRDANPDNLFATYFKPYRDNSLNPIVRDNTEPNKDPFVRFQQLYWNNRFAEALTAFEALDPSLQENDNLLFLKANLLLAIGHTNEAAAIFSTIIQNNRSRYLEEALWYEALCFLKNRQWEDAKKRLTKIAAKTGAPHQYDATQLLAHIR